MSEANTKVDRLVVWMKCIFKHDWLYDGPVPSNGKWHRECRRCEKRQHGKYNNQYGYIDWRDGW